jgi:hypothetical protein
MSRKNGPSIITNGLVLYLDAANKQSYVSGSTSWIDVSNNNNNGTLINGPTFNTGSGGSIVFDGTNDYISGSSSSNFAFGTGDFTVSHWMYVNAFSGTGTPTFIDTRNNTLGTGPGYSDYIETNKFKLYISNATVYTSTGSITTGNWYNISVTRQSTTMSVYFNGILDGTTTNISNMTENGLLLARNINTSGTSYLNGRIASVLIYKGKGLNTQEVLQNYNATKGRFGL